MTNTIILQRREYGWTAMFFGVGRMPEDYEIPLPFSSLAYLQTVANDMRKRFAGARVLYRTNLGTLTQVAS
jgi:hypothetical protein